MRGPRHENASYPSSTEPSFVRIPRDEYGALLDTAVRYNNLCTNLLFGGVEKNAIDLLSSQSQQPMPESEPRLSPINKSNTIQPRPPTFPKLPAFAKHASPPKFDCPPDDKLPRRRTLNSSSDGTIYSESKGGDEVVSSNDSHHYKKDGSQSASIRATPVEKPHYEMKGNRTVQFTGLPETISYREIVCAVRGGKVLEIHMKPGDGIATVSFVHPSDAAAFLEHALKWDLYIKKEKIGVRWAMRQYTLSKSTIHRLGLGATRNFAIRYCSSGITPKEIRDDLEHIHNLSVLGVNFKDGDYYIRTNSVSGAYFARTCMISRLKYRKCRFDWLPDECADPLPIINKKLFDPDAPKQTLNPSANRFEVLRSE